MWADLDPERRYDRRRSRSRRQSLWGGAGGTINIRAGSLNGAGSLRADGVGVGKSLLGRRRGRPDRDLRGERRQLKSQPHRQLGPRRRLHAKAIRRGGTIYYNRGGSSDFDRSERRGGELRDGRFFPEHGDFDAVVQHVERC